MDEDRLEGCVLYFKESRALEDNGICSRSQRKPCQEEGRRSKMKQKALKECEFFTSKYAQCAMGRTLSVVWKCRKQAAELNDCLHQFTNDSVLEEMKRTYTLQQDAKEPARA